MSRRTIHTLLLLTFAGLTGLRLLPSSQSEAIPLSYPESWPDPVYDLSRNPPTKAGIFLGRKLFYEPLLSADKTVTCASCHLSYTAFAHTDHALSHGIGDSIGTRNAPSLINLAWNNYFMWDGAINHLDMQPLAPISSPLEMGENLPNIARKLQNSPAYPVLFRQAFGDSAITGERILKALTQFQLTLISCNSRYDRIMRSESGYRFTEQESRGHRLFLKNCASCHKPPLFTNGTFACNGLPPDTLLNDYGRLRITQKHSDSLLFKVPTLRNIEYSYPYMHDGRFRSLREVIRHYSKGVQQHENTAQELRKPIHLTPDEETDLLAFLLTLSDRDFLFNPDFAYPHMQGTPKESP